MYYLSKVYCIVLFLFQPENIVLKEKDGSDVKLVDFGLAQVVRPTDDLREMMGTPEFVAPEVINYDRIGLYTDMWYVFIMHSLWNTLSGKFWRGFELGQDSLDLWEFLINFIFGILVTFAQEFFILRNNTYVFHAEIIPP